MRPTPAVFPIPAFLGPLAPSKRFLGAVSHALLACSLTAVGTWAAPETLTFVKEDSTAIRVLIDYDRHPDIPSESGLPWEGIEKDSVYTTGTGDDATLHVRYVKAFYAEMDGRKGFGSEYIHFTGPPEPRADRDPVYTAECEFHFPDGSSGERLHNPTVHLNDFPRLTAEYRAGAALGTPFGLRVGSGSDTPVLLVSRTPGWEVPVAAGPAGGSGNRYPAGGWMVRLDGSRVPRVPEGRSKVRLIDVTGRSAWQAEGLRPGEALALPAHLGPGAFRYHWMP